IGTIRERVYPVGRLDMDSEGLLLLTNDGDLTLRLTHPRYHIEKTYIVEVKGCITEQELTALTTMTVLDGEPIKPVRAVIIKADESTTVIDMRLTEGKNRQIRRMCCQCFARGKHVVSLTRTAIGALRIGDLEKGKYRPLKPEEIKYLKDCTNDKNNPDTRTKRKA
ncbi:MAG TPA: pseudouridine synthase, partial [Bacillota bacterium]|nr:pseudouridine synthase [Bacillota bacterium]